MERLKTIGWYAIATLFHIVTYAVYTVDKLLSVFNPFKAMPKYWTWVTYQDDKGNYTYIGQGLVNTIQFAICLFCIYFLGAIFGIVSAFVFDAIVYLIKKVAMKKVTLIMLPFIALSLFGCNKEKIGKHNIECLITYDDKPCGETVEIWQGNKKVTLTGSDQTIEETFKNGTVHYRIYGSDLGTYTPGFKFFRKDAELIHEDYCYHWESGFENFDKSGTFEIEKN